MSRMCIEFGDDQAAALDRLAATFGGTKASVLRYGLTLLNHAVREARRGNSLAIVGPDGEQVARIVGAWDEVQPQTAAGA